MTKAQIKKIILDTMGNPVSGSWAKNADAVAEAIIQATQEVKTEKANTKTDTAQKEVRVEDAEEIR